MRFCPSCHLPYPEDDRTSCVVDGTPLVEGEGTWQGSVVGGRYRMERLLGSGGMAEVYRAHSMVSGHVVAIKVMHAHLAGDPELRERFRREARSAARLSHQNVIEVYDAGELPSGKPYIVMEFLEGTTLKDSISEGPLPLSRFLGLALGIARGLARAHDLGVIHRDLKPENVFVCPSAEEGGNEIAKIVDFGIARASREARLTAAGSLIGTPAYIAPERVRGDENTASSDLYSLGVLYFEMLTGRLPFLCDDVPGAILANLEATPPSVRSLSPSCPPTLDTLVLSLLEKDPQRRPVDAHQVVRALADIARALPADAALPSAGAFERFSSPPPATSPSNTLPRWERRAFVLGQALRRAYPNRVPAHELGLLSELEGAVARLNEIRGAQLATHVGLDRMVDATREARERLGHAVHVLGTDLSNEREALARLESEVLERRARVGDLELQIGELRAHLAEKERESDAARDAVERTLCDAGSEFERAETKAKAATQALVSALGDLPGGATFELGSD